MQGAVRGGEREAGALAGRWAAYGLLVVAFATGGSSQRWGLDDFIVRGLSLPIAAWAAWALLQQRPPALIVGAAITACVLSLLPLLQLVSLPPGAWGAVEARAALAADLAAVGVEPAHHWSLAPTATWRAWAATLPGLACFLAGLAFVRSPGAQRSLLRLVVGLAVASMLLGIVQMGLPQDSLLNPFPEWRPLFRGVFAHFNHQGTSAAIGMLVALALAIGAHATRHRPGGRRARPWEAGMLAFAAAFLLIALPLTTSRAAVTLAVVGLALVPLAMGLATRERLRRWPARLGVAVALGFLAIGLAATAGWMQVDDAYELRAPMRDATAALAVAHSPFGVGAGAFVPAFEQAAPDPVFRDRYINHAHNEYLHWWAELGWLAILCGVLAAWLLAAGAWRALRMAPKEDRDLLVASTAGIAMLLAHSVVEYPLRTTTLLAVGAALCAVLFRCTPVRAHSGGAVDGHA